MLRTHLKLSQLSHKAGPLARGTVLYAEGENATDVFYLESGLVKITRFLIDERQILVRIIRPRELFGECAAFSTVLRPCSAVVLIDAVVYRYTQREFRQLCRHSPEVWPWLTRLVANRLDEAERRIQMISYCRVEHRLLLSLAELAGYFAVHSRGERHISIPLSQDEVANLIGATRETTSTTLNALERRGLLQLGRRCMLVNSVEALRAAAARASRAASA